MFRNRWMAVVAGVGLLVGLGQVTPSAAQSVATAPAVTIADALVEEGHVLMSFKVRLSQAASGPVSVYYQTQNGTAIGATSTTYTTAHSDFYHKAGRVDFAAGQVSKTVTVQIKDDRLEEDTEYFVVKLTSVSGATIQDGVAMGDIFDNDRFPDSQTLP